ncbi:hypothetical protein P154DRAFT_615539 [Amniculicola lignicola CBS 123094]|uniref:Peptidase S9 prolyl oligopeptidase catalytic domain-containing protein n=1 Tax=Amniculicola lignicola CBS 123094 TaxID=1392246 RepID=A0A6A5WWJ8_9PLEO|nr:hypothetical protein P154DRAFT_615539 [Amniculicola lignicola CBS 123094]
MFASALLLACGVLLPASNAARHEHAMMPLEHRQGNQHSSFAFSTAWQVLGPFQIGTREATWGADPLEYLGGFGNLQYSTESHFRSSLPVNGIAKWSTTEAKQSLDTLGSAKASLPIGYSNVDWDFLKVVYGWAAVQYQAWARGEIIVTGNDTQHVVLYTDAILEFWVGDAHYFGGDFYTYRKAPPVLHLKPGTHKIDVRLVRDVRAFGGILEPTIDVVLELRNTSGSLELAKPGLLISDVVDGKLASPVTSVTLRNSGEVDVEIIDIQPSHVRSPVFLPERNEFQVVLSSDSETLTASQANSTITNNTFGQVIVAGQTRPVAFNVSLSSYNVSSVNYTITYKPVNGSKRSTITVSQALNNLSLYEPHKITYLHPGGMVSYAMLRAPAKNASCKPTQTSLPVLLQLHGAGLEADNGVVAHALDAVPELCAWVLFPTGVTPWSGDDWHNWGFTDVEAAIRSIPSWIKHVGWKGPAVDIDRWVVSGHSNGGQGTWYALTHRPDRLIAAAPVSGYASIQKYVPYELWQPMDPRRSAIISGSLNSYRHEMLMDNAQGIPVVQQHGEKDDNVPTYHSRFLSQLLFQGGTNSSYHELPGQGHWFDTIMTTDQMKEFYRKQTASNETLPRKLEEFNFVVADPGDMGSKGGIRVLNLEDPGQYGRVKVRGHVITTANIWSLELETHFLQSSSITIDGLEISLAGLASEGSAPITLSKADGSWDIGGRNAAEGNAKYRRGRQLGLMTAVLRTQGPFIIRHQGSHTAHVALQVARNLHQYFSADSEISSGTPSDDSRTGNVISVVIGDVPPSLHPDFPIKAGTTGVSIRDSIGGGTRSFDEPHLAAAFIRPLDGERLELVLWGSDEAALSQAARLVPMLTGVGQPDFVVLGKQALWQGVEGALSLGFFDHEWRVSRSSLV